MIKIGQEILPHIKKSDTGFEIFGFRNFDRMVENKKQQTNYKIAKVKYDQIESVWIYIVPFTMKNTISHTIIGFEDKDRNEICISREAQFEQGEERNIISSISKGYRAIVLRGSATDMFGLRDNIRGEKIIGYKCKINNLQKKILLDSLVDITNDINSKYTKYNIISKNCTSGVWGYIYNKFDLPKRNWRLIFTTFIPNILLKKGYIYSKKYSIIYDTKHKVVIKNQIEK